jgi:hypothetical protein
MARRLTVGVLGAGAAAALALPGAAGAGGFATVGLSSLPDGTAPGRTWPVTLTILQHGRTPLSGLHPTVRIQSDDGRTTRTFAARPAGKAGVYRANVVFPDAGGWTYTISDGFSQTHSFAPVQIGGSRAIATPGRERPSGAPQAGPATRSNSARGDADDGGNVAAALGAAVAAGLLAALLTAALVRRRPPGAAAAASR